MKLFRLAILRARNISQNVKEIYTAVMDLSSLSLEVYSILYQCQGHKIHIVPAEAILRHS